MGPRLTPRGCAVLLLICVGASPSKTYTAAIAGSGSNGGVPIVANIVNSRVPAPGQTLRVIVEPNVADDTLVVWSSADGKNVFGPVDFSGARDYQSRYQATLSEAVAVYPHDHALGGAIIVANIGPPVNARATFYVHDEAAIGFGCYGFIASGPSVKIVDGFPQRATLSDADVAVVGQLARALPVPDTAA